VSILKLKYFLSYSRGMMGKHLRTLEMRTEMHKYFNVNSLLVCLMVRIFRLMLVLLYIYK